MQHKIWKPGEAHLKNNAAYGQQQNRVWDPGRQGLKAHDQEIMNHFNLGSLMQEHRFKKILCILIDIGGSHVFSFL